ncbi:hypothetical protein [Mycolicibacterium sp. XJ870]
MNDDEFWSATDQLKLIYQWARARYAAPKGVLGSTMLRVAASTEPCLQLPGVIGGPASLNMAVVLVSKSGGGKGICDKVGAQAWPASVIERPIGSGEGIAATFIPPKKEGATPVTRAILSVPEIDTLAGMAARQGNILLAQLKSALMGELLGQSNASEATTRIVQAHTYRCCLSIGAQPGHTGVLFNDTTGGTPQRMIWLPTTDPDMPADQFPDPAPLNVDLPAWARGGGVITYGPDKIRETIIAAHLARQRGEGDSLDGHALLTRCKVAAVLAIMHHRSVVSDLHWQLSEAIMQWSNSTRDWILDQAKQAARAKVRERAIARAVGDEVYDTRLLEGVKGSILRTLERDGEQAGNVLRSRMGKRDRRDMFDQAIALLEHERRVASIAVDRGSRYRLAEVQGEPPVQGASQQVSKGEPKVQGEPQATVTDLDSRRSHDSEPPKVSARQWFDNHITELREVGQTTAESFAVYEAGQAAGYKQQSLRTAASGNPDVKVIARNGRGATWDITGTHQRAYRSAAEWTAAYLDAISKEGTEIVDKDAFRHAASAAGYSWTAARHAATESGRIESAPGAGSETVWRLMSDADEDAS